MPISPEFEKEMARDIDTLFAIRVLGVEPQKKPEAGWDKRLYADKTLAVRYEFRSVGDPHRPGSITGADLPHDIQVFIPCNAPEMDMLKDQNRDIVQCLEDNLRERFSLEAVKDYLLATVFPSCPPVGILKPDGYILNLTRQGYQRIAEHVLDKLANLEKGPEILGMDAETYQVQLKNKDSHLVKLIADIVHNAEFSPDMIKNMAITFRHTYKNPDFVEAMRWAMEQPKDFEKRNAPFTDRLQRRRDNPPASGRG